VENDCFGAVHRGKVCTDIFTSAVTEYVDSKARAAVAVLASFVQQVSHVIVRPEIPSSPDCLFSIVSTEWEERPSFEANKVQNRRIKVAGPCAHHEAFQSESGPLKYQ